MTKATSSYAASLLLTMALLLFMGGSAAAQYSNNPRYQQFRDTAAASISNPGTGNVRLFFDSTGFYWKNSAGTSTALGGGGLSGLTTGNIPVATSATAIGDSIISQPSTSLIQILGGVDNARLYLRPNAGGGSGTLGFTATNGTVQSGIFSTAGTDDLVFFTTSSFTERLRVNATAVTLPTTSYLAFSSDTSIHRNAAGIFEFTKGASSAVRASLLGGSAEFYDDTASTGATTLTITPGAGQGSAALLSIASASPAAGTGFGIRTTAAENLSLLVTSDGAQYANIKLNSVLNGAQTLKFNGAEMSLDIAGTGTIRWSNDAGAESATKVVGLTGLTTGVLVATDGSTGVGPFVFSLPVAATTTTHTVLVRESGYFFTTEGAGGAFDFDLPPAAAGLTYTFYCHASTHDITIDADTGDTIRGATVSGAGGTAMITDAGAYITIVAINATEWIIIASNGAVVIT